MEEPESGGLEEWDLGGAAAPVPETAPGSSAAPEGPPGLRLAAALSRPVVAAGQELDEAVYALIRLQAPAAIRPARLDFCFLVDASASMFHFRLDPAQRAHWHAIAESRGDVQRQVVDGRPSVIWSGKTLQELRSQVSTPMYCALRGLWRGLAALQPADRIAVIAFADRATLLVDDPGEAGAEPRLPALQGALEPLAAGAARAGVGHNTRLGQALGLAFQRLDREGPGSAVRRAVIVSDGRIEDAEACSGLIEAAIDRDLVISAIGVGQEFDEEFLMRIADATRGRYCYAPTAKDLEAALGEEFAAIRDAVVQQATLRITPAREVVFQELVQVSPEMRRFPVMWLGEESSLYRLGSLGGDSEAQFAAAFALPPLPEGEASLAQVEFGGLPVGDGAPLLAACEVRLLAAADPMLAGHRDDATMDVVHRLQIFLEERKAQIAHEEGDEARATRHLEAATRMLRRLGDESLAAEMEAEASSLATGTRDQSRTKRIKAGTRRLGKQ
jgi:Ca-activated chloride channel family protein